MILDNGLSLNWFYVFCLMTVSEILAPKRNEDGNILLYKSSRPASQPASLSKYGRERYINVADTAKWGLWRKNLIFRFLFFS